MLSKRFRITLRRWQTPYRSIHLEIKHDSLKSSKIYFARLLLWIVDGLCIGEFDRKSNRNQIYPPVEAF